MQACSGTSTVGWWYQSPWTPRRNQGKLLSSEWPCESGCAEGASNVNTTSRRSDGTHGSNAAEKVLVGPILYRMTTYFKQHCLLPKASPRLWKCAATNTTQRSSRRYNE
jgi:hypothetical protein